MDKNTLIITSEFGQVAPFEAKKVDEILASYLDLKESLNFQLILVLGSQAETLITHCKNVEEFQTQFSSDTHSYFAHLLDSIREQEGKIYTSQLYPCPPLTKWQEWLQISETIEEGELPGFYSFSEKNPLLTPLLINDTGISHLRALFRQKNHKQIRDFDWRKIKNVAKKSITNQPLSALDSTI